MKKASLIKVLALMLVIFTLFSMSTIGVVADTTDTTSVTIPEGQQAVHTLKISRGKIDRVNVTLGSFEIFSISSGAMKLCGAVVQGKYADGDYTLTSYINPAQKMLFVELTLPDGGVVSRGTSAFTDYTTISVTESKDGVVVESDLRYEDVAVAEYKLTETEPAKNAYSKKFYNIVSSFSDATSDRLFAFTAVSKFVGSGTMAVRYKEAGAAEWTVVEATLVPEATAVSEEDYYKAEITGLKAGTKYEYQVGKKDSTSANDWSVSYTFTTAEEKVKEFSFIAIGDTQGYEWNHFKYMKAALEEAAKHVSDPAFILHTGDVVDSGYEAYQWKRYFTALGNYGTTIANFVAIGNHDTRNAKDVLTNDNLNNYFQFYFNHPDAASDALVMDPAIYEGLSASGKVQVNNFNETIYSYNYGSAHFIVLNTGTYVNTGNETYPDDQHIIEAQRAWLEKDLEANKDAKWTIILCHEAMYHKNGKKQDRMYLTDIIEKYGVDLVIQGHSHIFSRSYPMKNGEIATKAVTDVIEKGTGTIYMTIGATTPSHSEMGTSTVEAMQKIIFPANDQAAYTTVDIKNGKLILTTRQLNGLVLDTFTIQGEEEPEEVITEAPSTDAIASDVPATDGADTPADAKGGCGAAVSFVSLAVVAALGTCTAFVAKKKDN